MKVNKKKLELYIFITAALAAVVGFLFSRAILSISTIILCANGFLWGDIKRKWEIFICQPYLIGLTMLFFIPLFSGLHSSDTDFWCFKTIQKIPLLFLPFSLSIIKDLKLKHILFFNVCWIGLVFSGTIWSSYIYFENYKEFHNLYKIAKLLPTWAENDYIRFSMAILTGILFWIFIEENKLYLIKPIKWAVRIAVAWLIIFLHLLSSKTGLAGLYLIILPLYSIKLWRYSNKIKSILFLSGGVGVLFIAIKLFPTLAERINYIIYDNSLWLRDHFTGTDSDSNRIISLRAGWDIWKENLFWGIGYGDIIHETSKWFSIHMPNMPVEKQLVPHNQWLFMAVCNGIIGVVAFSIIIILPFFKLNFKDHFSAYCFWILMFIVFLYESTIETQRGVYIFTFGAMWWHLMLQVNFNNQTQ